ncbi:DUF4390 domain-containing protein [Pseudothauera rhizosphaerae]|uniref:DUF4390 domain-containing protein n=1 Tax=Pseudothauera rhizosphaerae TaxID=2565932 RepID=A0A4V3WB60_9RHOO|nr:DUF4390 domain-containing protein [Pseudothauera rhizosphaerae]THF62026.1 DUF4390 domain-containing protein [Pseudothauera rhizosphaerae]
MTASTTPSSPSLPERLLRCLLLLAFWLPLPAAADEAVLRQSEIVLREEGYVVNADIDFELNPRLTDAINRGVSLYFVTEFVIERPRWYWFDEVVVERRLNYRIAYHAITRSYRLSLGSFHQSFDTLEGAVRTIQRVRNWQVAERDTLGGGQSYNAALRFRLDTSQLPKPFQVTAIGSRDWRLDTDWMTWTFLAGAPVAR